MLSDTEAVVREHKMINCDTLGVGCMPGEYSGSEDGDGADDDVGRVLRCDLLILDDLGTELTTSFVQSAMYQLVNTRLITGKKTVISTNLSPNEIGRRYGAPVLSRLQGEYQMLLFFGEDIRRKRQK